MRKIIGLMAVAIMLSSCGSDEVAIKKEEYGSAWPFPGYDSLKLKCVNKSFEGYRRKLVLVDLGGEVFGLNGTAHGAGKYPDARSKMARHPQYDTYILGATDTLIKRGKSLCKGGD